MSASKLKVYKTIAVSLTGIALLMQILKRWGGGSIEKIYSRQFYSFFNRIKGELWGWFPWSMGDFFYLLVSLWLLFLLFSCIRSLFEKKKVGEHFLQLYISVIFLWVSFDLSWGLNYYRMPFYAYLNLSIEEVEEDKYSRMIEDYILKTNELRGKIDASSQNKERAKKEIVAWIQQDSRWEGYLSKHRLRLKRPIFSPLVSYTFVSGYFNPFTHEAHVNEGMPLSTYPFTVAHELAHKMGVGFEDECNFIAFLYLKESEDPWYRYAAYLSVTQYFLRDIRHMNSEAYERLLALFSDKVKLDLQEENEYWEKYASFYGTLSSRFYHFYLLGNNQPEGLARYSQVSRLLYSWENRK